ncbi:MAG: hypothetical protein ABW123_11845 [Cystobacter sp.]
MGDGKGSLALMNSGPLGATAWDVVSRTGVYSGTKVLGGDLSVALLPQPRGGFHLIRIPPGGATLAAYTSDGTPLTQVRLTTSDSVPYSVSADPRGGTLVAQWAPRDNGTQVLTFQFFDPEGVPRAAPVESRSAPLNESRSILAATDTLGRTLLMWTEPGLSTSMGQWVKRNGNALTPPFAIPVIPPTFTGRLSPLAGGGLALQVQQQWVLQFPSGEAHSLPAPAWLADQPGSRLELIRGKQANLLLPPPEFFDDTGCQETLLFFTSEGSACGELAVPLGGNTCFRRQLGVGVDGTVIQQLELNITANTQCAWRWWPQALR